MPVTARSVRSAFAAALSESGVHKQACVHTLHHLLEARVNLRQIQAWLRHRSLRTTTIVNPPRRSKEKTSPYM